MYKENSIKKAIGIWIDHRKAVIVSISDAGEEITKITSEIEKHVRFSGGPPSEDGSVEGIRDRQFGNHLNNYYDKIFAVIRDAEAIQIFGPGEAKGELEKGSSMVGSKGASLRLKPWTR